MDCKVIEKHDNVKLFDLIVSNKLFSGKFLKKYFLATGSSVWIMGKRLKGIYDQKKQVLFSLYKNDVQDRDRVVYLDNNRSPLRRLANNER